MSDKADNGRFVPTNRESPASMATNVILITTGSLILAWGVNAIVIPKQFLSAGVLGVSLAIHYLVPSIGVGLLYAIINIPLVALGWFKVGHRFMYYTAFGILVFSMSARFLKPPPIAVDDLLLSAILAGIISGIGMGIVLRSAGSTGGVDILAIFFNKKWEIRMGWTYLAFNGLVLFAGALIFSLETALYSLIYVFTASRVIDAVISGFNQRKQILIISEESKRIADRILEELNRGVTFLEGRGAYTDRPKEVIMSIVTMTELGRVKDLIYDLDPHAFVIINDTLEVLGKRHGARRIY
ncbi:MAG: YitT family protein [Deltaproteobacteria bacterium]|nr:YitT family protein [Deltaproteobacteria bacterium]